MEHKVLTAVFWKKIWVWIKHHWYFPVILALLLFAVFAGRSTRTRVFDLMSKQREQYKKEVKVVVEANEEKTRKQKELFEKHREVEKKIEKDFDLKIENLEKEKKKEIDKIVEEHGDDTEVLARMVAEALSAEYAKKEWENNK